MAERYELPRVPAAEAGVSPRAVLDLLHDWAKNGHTIHSFMLLRGGKVAAEGYWHPYRAGDVHALFSLSKSFTSTAILFAMQEGLLSPDEPLVSFFPDKAEKLKISDKMRSLNLRHLLSMCTGHEPSADFIFGEDDPVAAFLESELPGEPGARFSYNTGATFMLSAALQARTGQNLLEFLRPRLFEPLGLSDGIWSEMTRDRICYGGFGLNVTTEDIVRFGLLYLCRGEIFGKRILAPELIDEATRRHIPNCKDAKLPLDHPALADGSVEVDMTSDWGMGYGWQFWRCVPEGVYRGDGAFGQFCVVMPKQDAVLAITASTGDLQNQLRSVWDKLLPGMCDNPSPEGQDELERTLAGLALPAAEGSGKADVDISGAEYKFVNGEKPFTIRFDFEDDTLVATIGAGGNAYIIKAGYGKHIYNTLPLMVGSPSIWRGLGASRDIAASWAWNKNGALVVKSILTKHVYTDTAEISFEGDKAIVKLSASPQMQQPLTFEGIRA